MAEHSPAPWQYKRGEWASHFPEEEDSGFHLLMGADDKASMPIEEHLDYCIGLYPEDGEQYEIAEANIRLMVASPEMLGLLKKIRSKDDYHKQWTSNPVDLAELDTVIAKAEGSDDPCLCGHTVDQHTSRGWWCQIMGCDCSGYSLE